MKRVGVPQIPKSKSGKVPICGACRGPECDVKTWLTRWIGLSALVLNTLDRSPPPAECLQASKE